MSEIVRRRDSPNPFQLFRKRGATLLLTTALVSPIIIAYATTGRSPATVVEEKVGGQTTVYATGRNAFSFPAANLSDAEHTRFVIGNSFFRRNWVEAPASTRARDGLGPHFIARSCGGCHLNDGRGAPPEFQNGKNQPPVALLLRLSIAGLGEHGAPLPDPVYGGQFNNAAIQGVKPMGNIGIRYTPVHGRFADSTHYTLQKPSYRITQLAYGLPATSLMISPRIAPQMIGLGLLDAIREADIEQNVRDQAALNGPFNGSIRGQINRVWDAPSQQIRLGRFGWKANVASLAHQTAGAFLGDIGITSSLFPKETCTRTMLDCLKAPRSDSQPEIDGKTLDDVIFYSATLAPPAARNIHDAQVQRGQQLFSELQCAVCHRPSYLTGDVTNLKHSSTALSQQRIWPYTDLLVHDMGHDLADNRPDFQANGRQWRTPPLWGIGLIKDVNGHQRLLHDGRANGVLEAILWHSGEAENSKRQVLKLNKTDRDALVKFVESR